MTCVTHHYACDCREAEFAQLKAERDALAEKVRKVREECEIIDTSLVRGRETPSGRLASRILALLAEHKEGA